MCHFHIIINVINHALKIQSLRVEALYKRTHCTNHVGKLAILILYCEYNSEWNESEKENHVRHYKRVRHKIVVGLLILRCHELNYGIEKKKIHQKL